MQITHSEEKISEHEDIVIETIQNETHRGKNLKSKGKSLRLGATASAPT